MSDLRQRVPGHSLIEQLLREWDLGNIHPGNAPGEIVIDDEARGWYLGVHGERWVATRLALLGPGYTVLHSVPVGRGDSDIDHVVVGPSGVFTINTKYSPGKQVWSKGFGIYVGGQPQSHYIRNLGFEVHRATQRLSRAVGATIRVTGLLVFVDPSHMSRKAPPGDGTQELRVVSDAVLRVIEGPAVFTDEQVAQLAEAAARPQTWHDNPQESAPGSHIALEFSALEEAVGPLVSMAPRTSRSQSQTPPTSRQPASRRSTHVSVASRPNSRRPSSRGRGRTRKKTSRLESLVASALLIAFGWWMLTIVQGLVSR